MMTLPNLPPRESVAISHSSNLPNTHRYELLEQHTLTALITVSILGVESTGKTTLCKDLATHFKTEWVPEYMRSYLQRKLDDTQTSITWDDLLPIAYGQMALENQKAQVADRYLFCDTSLFELMVYADWYYGRCPEQIETAALNLHYDLVLLTEIDVPWEADDLRDAPLQRHAIDAYFVERLERHNISYRRIGGNRQTRVNKVALWLEYVG